MTITYALNKPLTSDDFIDLLIRSTLGERRPVEDRACIEGMLKHSNLSITAWDNDKLVGIARSVTDFHYACYLSDLAVDKAYQRQGIGKQLQILTQAQLGKHAKLILLAAPLANDYYPSIGYSHMPRCWIVNKNTSIKSP